MVKYLFTCYASRSWGFILATVNMAFIALISTTDSVARAEMSIIRPVDWLILFCIFWAAGALIHRMYFGPQNQMLVRLIKRLQTKATERG